MSWYILCVISLLIAIVLVIILNKQYADALNKIKNQHQTIIHLHQRNYNFYNLIREKRNREMKRRTITPNDNTSRVREQLLKEIEETIKQEGLI